MIRNSVLLLLSCSFSQLFSFSTDGSLGSSWSSFTSTMEGVGSTFKQVGEGMAESFGMNPPGYNYSFRVLNFTNKNVTVEAERIKSFQGMFFYKGSIKTVTLSPGGDTGATGFNDIGLYLKVKLSYDNNLVYSNQIINLNPEYKKDGIVYFYNVCYANGGWNGEFLGPDTTTSTEFQASIYNSINSTQTITFPFAGDSFTVSLDPNSFNILQDDINIPHCIRNSAGNRILDFGKAGNMPIMAQGLAVGTNQDGTWKNVSAQQIHYKIIGSENNPEAVVQGYSPGNFDQITNTRLRSIAPVWCLIWNKSSEQMSPSSGNLSFYPEGYSEWVAYKADGWSSKQYGIKDTLIAQLPRGNALQFLLIRPMIDQPVKLSPSELLQTENLTVSKKFAKENTLDTLGVKLSPVDIYTAVPQLAPTVSKAPLYIVSINTTDQTKAQQFLTNLLDGKLTVPQGPAAVTVDLTPEQEAQLLSQPFLNGPSAIVDPESGVSGYLLASDIFTPYGSLQNSTLTGPYYYTVSPPTISTNQLYNYITLQSSGYLNTDAYSSEAEQTKIQTTLNGWITTAFTYPLKNGKMDKTGIITQLRDSVTQFLQTYGSDILFKVVNGQPDRKTPTFSQVGNITINQILGGPQGIVNTPIQWVSGMNNSIYTGPYMPTTRNAQNKPVLAWKPTQTVDLTGKKPAFAPPAPTNLASTKSTT